MGTASRFRPDIQGLRAVAVLTVALDHANVWPFHSGFIGVDVFFVISGFLITQLLLVEAQRDHRISLRGFFARRARRILPAATLVMLVVVLGAVALLSRVDAVTVARDAAWATLFAANVNYGRQGTDYFAADTLPSPLQHYWSLAIEEQFYLVWPLLLAGVVALALRAARRHRHETDEFRRSMTVGAVSVLVLAILASFAASIVLTGQDPLGAYFSTYARVWELGIGGLAAVAVPLAMRAPAGLRSAASWAGLVAIGWSAVFVDAAHFPGWVAAVPVLGTAALLLGGVSPTARGPQGLLSLPPMRLVGDWSYSFYLWHWPVLVFAARLWREPEGLSGIALLALALAVSGLTYTYVEGPFRRPRSPRPASEGRPARPGSHHTGGLLLYPVAVGLSLAVAVSAGTLVQVGDGDGAAITPQNYGREPGTRAQDFSEDPRRALVQASALAARNDQPVPGDLVPDVFTLKDDVPDVGECDYNVWPKETLCRRGVVDAERVIVVVGDSHGRAWIPAVEKIARTHGYATYYFVKQGCTGADLIPYSVKRDEVQEGCLAFRDWAIDTIEELHPELTLLASDAPDAVQRADGTRAETDEEIAVELTAGTLSTLDRLRGRTERVVVIGDGPGMSEQPGLCLTEQSADLADCAGDLEGRGRLMNRASHQAAKQAGVDFVDPTPWFCAYGVCPIVVGRTITYRDLEHISASYAEELAGPLAEELGIG